ncbi:MAG TPA: class I SAM-dependent methyltransferase [Aggregicoccus sp.]|nr:class I SAM-dependent methyltransferase [Aggregicoccus sp.]
MPPSVGAAAPTLAELYAAHAGKVSQKWRLYLEVYERALRGLREAPIAMVEVGVQNGGSLEIWAKYFPRATAIVGCDVDPKCAELRFDDPRIAVVVAPVNTAAAARAILARANPIDVFIDDGSHFSPDIVVAFCNYFPALRPGGLYLAEDLHAAYRPDFMGGLEAPNAMRFFCALVDGIHHEYWQEQADPGAMLQRFLPAGAKVDARALVDSIASICFHDSLCIVEKRRSPAEGRLGERVIAGSEALVHPGVPGMGGLKPV